MHHVLAAILAAPPAVAFALLLDVPLQERRRRQRLEQRAAYSPDFPTGIGVAHLGAAIMDHCRLKWAPFVRTGRALLDAGIDPSSLIPTSLVDAPAPRHLQRVV